MVHFGVNKEVLGAKLYLISKELQVVQQSGRVSRGRVTKRTSPPWKKVHTRTDYQTAIAHLQHLALRPGQWLTHLIIVRMQYLVNIGGKVEVHWVPG